MAEIKRYENTYKYGVQRICLETSAFKLSKKGMKDFLLLTYCDYYIQLQKENCFVAVSEDDDVLGYILCAENFKEYKDLFCKQYMPKIRRLGFEYVLMAAGEIFSHALLSKSYGAHLHIDLTASCRRQGVGTALITALKGELSQKGIHSLMLCCGSSNTAAVSFYKKNGFKIKLKFPGSYIMTLNF